MKPPFKLASDTVSGDTIAALSELLAHAKRGHVIGLAFCAMYKGRRYITNTAGEAKRNPTFTRGMVAALDDHLGDMVKKDMA